MKKVLLYFTTVALFAVAGAILLLKSFTISSLEPKDCEEVSVKITDILEGSSHDIVFKDNDFSSFYINRGLERGLNLDSLKTKVLNKTVTLHLAKVMGGRLTSDHICQLKVNGDTLFTEF
jgi:hypothetical protein